MKKITLLFFLILVHFATPVAHSQEGKKVLSIEYEQAQIILTVNGDIVHIRNASVNALLEIYNILGVKVSSAKIDSPDKTILLTLPRGCYILKIDNLVRKISIK